MEKYISDKKISTVEELSEKTPAGSEMVKVNFEDGSSEEMPKRRLEIISSDERCDKTATQNKLIASVGATIFGTLHEFGVKIGETNAISDAVVDFINNGFKKSEEILYGVEYGDISLNNINKILIKNAAEKDNNGTSSTGSGTDNENKD